MKVERKGRSPRNFLGCRSEREEGRKVLPEEN